MNYLIKSPSIINEGKIITADILIKNSRIEKIAPAISRKEKITEINAEELYLMPGIIDDQVHFREPGLTHKGDIYKESRAAVAGGVTSFMDMPNVNPPSLTHQLLEERYKIASQTSLANYSFYMGVSNNNLDEVFKTNPQNVCGVKIFMGSSTGNMLVDDERALENLFRNSPALIATHCEDEQTINRNLEKFNQQFGENIPIKYHPQIRNEEACSTSSSFAVELAKKHGTRLHILHISTADELQLFDTSIPLKDKKITAEVCVHHLYFDSDDYETLGTKIKWNPAIKDKQHKHKLLQGLLNNKLDVVATDHAPHTLAEKSNPYSTCPSGAPMIQHSLQVMLTFYHNGKLSLEKIAEKMSHAPAICFKIKERGFIREGYFADMFLLDLNKQIIVSKNNIFYKCGWSPLEGKPFKGAITHTLVNGHLAYVSGKFNNEKAGFRLQFEK
jgi:dihydroorotase